jgi:hypothetical protein
MKLGDIGATASETRAKSPLKAVKDQVWSGENLLFSLYVVVTCVDFSGLVLPSFCSVTALLL